MYLKKLFIVGLVIALFAGGYVLFTLKSGEELDEVSPLGQVTVKKETPSPDFKDSLDSMSEEKMREFMKEVEAMREVVMEKNESVPPQVRLLAQGDFMRRFHDVEGRALLINEDTQATLRFEDFLTDNGPQLHIYLSDNLGADDFIDLGTIRATKGNINYAVPAGTDTSKYRYVLVWCKPFGVLFSYAELKPL